MARAKVPLTGQDLQKGREVLIQRNVKDPENYVFTKNVKGRIICHYNGELMFTINQKGNVTNETNAFKLMCSSAFQFKGERFEEHKKNIKRVEEEINQRQDLKNGLITGYKITPAPKESLSLFHITVSIETVDGLKIESIRSISLKTTASYEEILRVIANRIKRPDQLKAHLDDDVKRAISKSIQKEMAEAGVSIPGELIACTKYQDFFPFLSGIKT